SGGVRRVVGADPGFAGVRVGVARPRGFRAVAAARGAIGLALRPEPRPHALTPDIRLPDISGWRLLSQLKNDLATRHIPVHVISVHEGLELALAHGAIGVAAKPLTPEAVDAAVARLADCVARPVKNLLLIEDDDVQRENLVQLIGNGDVHTTAVATAEDALAAVREQRFDCTVVDLGLPDMDGIQLIEQLRREPGYTDRPIIVYTARELAQPEEDRL